MDHGCWIALCLFSHLLYAKAALENVALRKQTSTTSGVWPGGWAPGGAVDGNNRFLDYAQSCFHALRSPSDWTVDLGQPYDLYTIRVYFRMGYYFRSAGSQVYLDYNRSNVCYTLPGTISGTYLDMTCNATGRDVTIRNPMSNGDSDLLNICEVEIYACSERTYGFGCDLSCHCALGSCNRWSGACHGDCLSGWRGDRCDIECLNTYGVNCANQCVDRKCSNMSATCSRFDGSCGGQCHPGWRELDCTKECSTANYGQDCSKICSARNCRDTSTCDHVTGSCDRGCIPGWRGVDCLEECADGSYGFNCSGQCERRHCAGQSACDKVSGECVGGCQSGWDGVDCTVCDEAHYGSECIRVCGERNCLGNSSCRSNTGLCDLGCVQGYGGPDCIEMLPPSSSNTTAVVAGVVVTILVVMIIVVVVIFLIRRKRQKDTLASTYSKDSREEKGLGNVYMNIGFAGTPPQGRNAGQRSYNKEEFTDEEEEDGSPVAVEEVSYANYEEIRQSNVVEVSQLAAKIATLEQQPEMIKEEFKQLPDTFIHPYDESQKAGNKEKNRFKGYYPYNYNRVVIRDDRSSKRGDYYNASFLSGYNCTNRFIAAQGPHKTPLIEDFWRVVWQTECAVVVMVTGLAESGKMKCLQYWPDQGQATYGEMTVILEEENVRADHTVRHLVLQRSKDSEKRHVKQFHYTTWPDHGVPDKTTILSFMRKVDAVSQKQTTPILVHCSAGIGRTGTYIAVDSLARQAEVEASVDVVGFVTHMRNERKNMIQNSNQLLFIYQALGEATHVGDTSLDADAIRGMDTSGLGDVVMGNMSLKQHIEVNDGEFFNRSRNEAMYLVLVLRLSDCLREEGSVDIISDIKYLSKHTGTHFTLDDLRQCVDYLQRNLESSGVYANV